MKLQWQSSVTKKKKANNLSKKPQTKNKNIPMF